MASLSVPVFRPGLSSRFSLARCAASSPMMALTEAFARRAKLQNCTTRPVAGSSMTRCSSPSPPQRARTSSLLISPLPICAPFLAAQARRPCGIPPATVISRRIAALVSPILSDLRSCGTVEVPGSSSSEECAATFREKSAPCTRGRSSAGARRPVHQSTSASENTNPCPSLRSSSRMASA
jgi:hypothetical protein